MAPDLRGNDLLLTASQQPLRLGESQTQVGEIGEIIRPQTRQYSLWQLTPIHPRTQAAVTARPPLLRQYPREPQSAMSAVNET
jgi:hypothetical protein